MFLRARALLSIVLVLASSYGHLLLSIGVSPKIVICTTAIVRTTSGFGEFSKHKDIPFGALVNFLPPKSLAERLPKFDTNGIPAIMMGYRTHPGGKWTGDYKVICLADFDEAKTTGRTLRCYSVK